MFYMLDLDKVEIWVKEGVYTESQEPFSGFIKVLKVWNMLKFHN